MNCKNCGKPVVGNTATSPIGGRVYPYMHEDGSVVCQIGLPMAEPAEPIRTSSGAGTEDANA